MLVLTRNRNTTVRIGPDISVTVREFIKEGVAVDVDYPPGLVLRCPAGEVPAEPAPVEADREAAPAAGAKLRGSFSLRLEDVFRVGDDVTVKVVALMGSGESPCRVRLGFQAPKSLRIERSDYKAGPNAPLQPAQAGQTDEG